MDRTDRGMIARVRTIEHVDERRQMQNVDVNNS